MHLIFFLSRATPLHRWQRLGILDREVAVYQRLRPYLAQLSIVTSGGPEELAYQEILGDIRLLYNRWRLSPNLYSLLAPLLHWRPLRQGTIYKTNQLDGSWTAVNAGRLHHKPVVVRAGYLWAENFSAQNESGSKSAVIRHLQHYALNQAQAVFLTTTAMKTHVVANDRVDAQKVHVVPNYVDTELFRPLPAIQTIPRRVCFIGRLRPVKNLHLLITAVASVPGASLVIIGAGSQQAELEALARRLRADVQFLGIMPNRDLPAAINQAQLFVLPSQFEGHPKALIEAMACGVAVVGTNVAGIHNVIRHQETGLLCDPTAASIAEALQRLFADDALRAGLGQAARAFVETEYSLNTIVRRELALLQQIQET